MGERISLEQAAAILSMRYGLPGARELIEDALRRGDIAFEGGVASWKAGAYAGGLTYVDLEEDENIRSALACEVSIDAADLLEWASRLRAIADAPASPMPSAPLPTKATDGPRRAAVAVMKRAVAHAQAYMTTRKLAPLTKQEAEEEVLAVLFRSTQQSRRRATSDLPNATRRRSSILANRNKELEDCRDFLRQRCNEIRQRE
jgi:hypothetical protein